MKPTAERLTLLLDLYYMQLNIVEVKSTIKNVNAYNVSSLLEIKQDK